MIIAEFRALLMHHVTTHWNDAIITAYDPVSAGNLPEEFSGAGNDIILLGDDHGDRDGLQTLKQFLKNTSFPAVVYFGSGEHEEKVEATRIGADGYIRRKKVPHDAFAVLLGDVLRKRRRIASTDSLFVGDARTGINPLIKGYRLLKKLAVSER